MPKGAKDTVTVRTPNGTVTRTPAGVATAGYDDVVVANARLGTPGARDQETAGDSAGFTQVDLIVRLPHAVTVTEQSLVVVTEHKVPAFNGTYLVVGIRPNELDQRVSLRERST